MTGLNAPRLAALFMLLLAGACSDYVSPEAATFIRQCKQGVATSLAAYRKDPTATRKDIVTLEETCVCLGQEIDRSDAFSAARKHQIFATGRSITVNRALPFYGSTHKTCEGYQTGVLITLTKIADKEFRYLPTIRWYFTWDSNGDGAVGGGDILDAALWLLLAPGDLVLDLVPGSALGYVGLGSQEYGGVLSWIISAIVAIFVLGAIAGILD